MTDSASITQIVKCETCPKRTYAIHMTDGRCVECASADRLARVTGLRLVRRYVVLVAERYQDFDTIDYNVMPCESVMCESLQQAKTMKACLEQDLKQRTANKDWDFVVSIEVIVSTF